MSIFGGIGFGEIVFVLILMIIVLGPKKMVEGARSLGQTIRKVTRSQFWKEAVKTSREIRDIPRKIINEAGVEEDMKEINRNLNSDLHKPLDENILPPSFSSKENPVDKSHKSPQSKE